MNRLYVGIGIRGANSRVTSKGDRHAAIAVTVMTPAKYIPVRFWFTAANRQDAKDTKGNRWNDC